eukprot:6191174-Pleurochrysis_carterae.AAC.3
MHVDTFDLADQVCICLTFANNCFGTLKRVAFPRVLKCTMLATAYSCKSSPACSDARFSSAVSQLPHDGRRGDLRLHPRDPCRQRSVRAAGAIALALANWPIDPQRWRLPCLTPLGTRFRHLTLQSAFS